MASGDPATVAVVVVDVDVVVGYFSAGGVVSSTRIGGAGPGVPEDAAGAGGVGREPLLPPDEGGVSSTVIFSLRGGRLTTSRVCACWAVLRRKCEPPPPPEVHPDHETFFLFPCATAQQGDGLEKELNVVTFLICTIK